MTQTQGTEKSVVNEKSIAVLPFTNMSNDAEGEIFCDGMMEDILTNLSRLNDLKVISRTSAIQYKNTKKKIPEIAEELGVAHILEGSVRKYGNKARITVQLIRAKDDNHIWADNYDRDLTDIFQVQSEVSQKIVETLKLNLTNIESDALKSTYKANPEAYQYYVQGKRAAELRSKEGLENSVFLLKKAIELDPNFADAYANLAFTIFLQERNYYIPRVGALKSIDSLANYSLDLDPNNIEGILQSSVKPTLEGRNKDALRIVHKALEKAPNNAMAHHAAAQTYTQTGDYDNCLKHRIKARDLNPLFWLFQSNLVETLMSIGELEKAASELERAKHLFPEKKNRFLNFEGRLYTLKGEYQKALDIYNTTLKERDWDHARMGYCFGKLRQQKKSLKTLDEIPNPHTADNYTAKAIVFAGLNEPDSLVHYLSKAEKLFRKEKELTNYGIDLVFHKRTLLKPPYFEEYRSLPGYQELIARMNDVEPLD